MITHLFHNNNNYNIITNKQNKIYTNKINEAINIPIRFSGNKKLWQDFIEKQALKLPPNATVIDAFGGSGIISYYITKIRPDIHVIYNDYDNYLTRVEHIQELEQIRKDLKQIAGQRTHGKIRKNNGLDKNKLSNTKKQKVLDYLNNRKQNNLYTDDNVIKTWLTYGFSARDEINNDTLLINAIPNTPFNIEKALEYAETLKPLKTKFDITNINKSKRLHKYLNDKNTYWILDPPYRDTDQADYKKEFSKEIEYAIAQIIKTNRVMLFCDQKEIKFYKPLFKTKPKTKNKEKLSFMNNARRTESCLYSW